MPTTVSYRPANGARRANLQPRSVVGSSILFVNRYRNRIKILYWDRDGFCIWYKQLERGVFELPVGGPAGVELDYKQLSRMLGGLDLRSGRRCQRRYHRAIVNS